VNGLISIDSLMAEWPCPTQNVKTSVHNTTKSIIYRRALEIQGSVLTGQLPRRFLTGMVKFWRCCLGLDSFVVRSPTALKLTLESLKTSLESESFDYVMLGDPKLYIPDFFLDHVALSLSMGMKGTLFCKAEGKRLVFICQRPEINNYIGVLLGFRDKFPALETEALKDRLLRVHRLEMRFK